MLVVLDATEETVTRLYSMGYNSPGYPRMGELYTPDLIIANTFTLEFTLVMSKHLTEGMYSCSIEDIEAIHILPTEESAWAYMHTVIKDFNVFERVKPHSPR